MSIHHPEPKTTSRRTRSAGVRRVRAARFGTAAVISLAMAGTIQPIAAFADVIDGAITDVWVEKTTVNYWDKVRVDMKWAVPNGSSGGDTFDLTLPPEMRVDPALTIPLKNGAGQVVANAAIVEVGGAQVARFTLTDFVNGKIGISGDAFFESSWNTNVVRPDTTVNFTFTTSTKPFPDAVVIDPLVQYTGPGKWQSWMDVPWGGENVNNHLQWGITSGMITADTVGKKVTITDTPGPGSQIDCTTIQVVYLNYLPDGTQDWASSRPPAAGEMTCSPTTMTIDVTLEDQVGKGLLIYGHSTVTDYTLTTYTNRGVVSVQDGATNTYDIGMVRSSAGGSGSGSVQVVSVGDYVWRDTDRDGVQDAGEPGIEGVALSITDPDGEPVKDENDQPLRALTDADGKYSFANLPTLPAGQGYTVAIDTNDPSTQNALAGLVATRDDGADPATDSSTGKATSTADLSTDGASDTTLDFGFVKPAVTVGDKVWRDADHNGVQDTGEAGIEGVVLNLTGPNGQVTDVNGALVGPATTNADGTYSFRHLPVLAAGEKYTVTVDKAASEAALNGLEATVAGAGTPATDSSTDAADSAGLTANGDQDLTLDFGYYAPAVSVGDRVWEDSNHNGVQDAGEPGIPGATLVLTGPDGQPVTDVTGKPVGPVTTAANGSYTFDNLPTLPAGRHYTVTVDGVPAGFLPTRANVGDPATDSSRTSATSGDLTTHGARDASLDFGFVKPVAVGDKVWEDSDGDGRQDTGEPGIGGVVLTLTGPDGRPVTDVTGKPVGPATTAADGTYLFENLPVLPAGDHYTVTIDEAASSTVLENYLPTTPGVGTAAEDSSTGSAEGTDLASGESDRTLDFGFVKPVWVGDTVWKDINGNGVQDTGETGIPGVHLTLAGPTGEPVTDIHGKVVGETVTSGTGWYVFENLPTLPAGQAYTVTVDEVASADALEGLTATTESAGTDTALDSSTGSANTTADLSTSAASDPDLDFGYRPQVVSVGDKVWFDTNHDGVQDPGEPGVPGVVLTIAGPDGRPVTDPTGKTVGSVTTKADGSYTFTGLPALEPGQSYTVTVDPAASAAALGVLVPTLTGTGDPATDSSGGSATSGDLTTDGASDTTLDFGYYAPAVSVGDTVWNDLDKDGVQDAGEPGLPDVTLTITGPDGQPVKGVNGTVVPPTTTGADGTYRFENLPALPAGQHYTVTVGSVPAGFVPSPSGVGDPSADSSTGSAASGDLTTAGASDTTLDFGFWAQAVSLGDTVWKDVNHNGTQDAGEPGIGGVTLRITGPGGEAVTDISGNPVVAQVTDADGTYLFSNLPVLPAGQHYTVTVDEDTSADALGVLVPTTAGVGDAAHDSSTGSATSGDLTTGGASDTTLDFGYYAPPVSVGDLVWRDANGNGLQDVGEPGIPRVVLTLTGPDGQPVTDVNGNVVGPTTTNADGTYAFEGLPALPAGQSYAVTLDGLASAAALAGLVPTTAGAGDDATLDSSTESARSDADLSSGGSADRNLDFGFAPGSVSVGDKVWLDVNRDGVQHAAEPGIAGVTLTVHGPDGQPVVDVYGNPVGPQVTDADGRYQFVGLPVLAEGGYTVVVDMVASADALDKLTPTITGKGTAATDSSTGQATSVNLPRIGDADPTLDFGFVTAPATVDPGDDPTDPAAPGEPGGGADNGSDNGTGNQGDSGDGVSNPGDGNGTTPGNGSGSDSGDTGTSNRGGHDSTASDSNTVDRLAHTGAEPMWLTMLAGALMGLGALLTRWRRRES